MTFRARRALLATTALLVCALYAPAAAQKEPAAKEHKVAIQDVKFTPREIKVKKGDTVIWSNADERDHTVTADDGSFDTDNIDARATKEITAPRAGEIRYKCTIHQYMTGVIRIAPS